MISAIARSDAKELLGDLRRALPDVAPDEELIEAAEDAANDMRMTADIVARWAIGSTVADEVEDYLKQDPQR